MTGLGAKSNQRVVRNLVGILIVLVLVCVFYVNRQIDLFDIAIRNEAELKSWASQNTLGASLIAVLLYAIASSLPIPIASIGSLLVGWLLGFWLGVPVVSIGSTLGASITFLSARYLFRDAIVAIESKHVTLLQQRFARDGVYFIAALRIIPGLPFFLVNSLLAQTYVSFRTFWITSMVCMLPSTAIYVATGASFPSLAKIGENGLQSVISWKLGVALVVLAMQPIIFRHIVAKHLKKEDFHV